MLKQDTTRTVKQSCERFPGHPEDPTQVLAGTQRVTWRNTHSALSGQKKEFESQTQHK